jgi:hypothetical protein
MLLEVKKRLVSSINLAWVKVNLKTKSRWIQSSDTKYNEEALQPPMSPLNS